MKIKTHQNWVLILEIKKKFKIIVNWKQDSQNLLEDTSMSFLQSNQKKPTKQTKPQVYSIFSLFTYTLELMKTASISPRQKVELYSLFLHDQSMWLKYRGSATTPSDRGIPDYPQQLLPCYKPPSRDGYISSLTTYDT